MLAASAGVMAQERSAAGQRLFTNGWFNHIDFAVTGGTSGIGFEFAAPMTDWARLRMGGVFRPLKHYDAKFGMEVSEGLSTKINDERFKKLADMMNSFTGMTPQKKVQMEGDLSMNNFKMLVDVFPFKNNRHWHATIGFYYGNGTLITAKNTAESMNTLTAVGIYNTMYRRALANENPIDISALGSNISGIQMTEYIQKLRKWGSKNNDEKGNPVITTEDVKYTYTVEDPFMGNYTENATAKIQRGSFSENGISIPIGKYARDVIAQEDIYYDYSEKLYTELNVNPDLPDLSINPNDDQYHYQKDANGRYVKKGEIRYRKGEVMHKEGENFNLVPDENNIVKVSANAARFKPYIGIGYELSINGDKRFNVGVDAGIMFWGNHPSVDLTTAVGVNAQGETIYMTYDMTRDLNDLRGGVKGYVNSVKQYPVFPEVSVRLSYRLW